MIICMGSSPEWHFWFCVQTKRTYKNAMLIFSFSFPSRWSCPFFSSPPYLCLLTRCIDIFSFLHFCHCNLYQQSRCLNNAKTHSFIQSRVQYFLPVTTIVYCHKRNSWETLRGDRQAQKQNKKNSLSTLFGGLKKKKKRTKKARLWIQRAIIQQSHSSGVHAGQQRLWRTVHPVSRRFL